MDKQFVIDLFFESIKPLKTILKAFLIILVIIIVCMIICAFVLGPIILAFEYNFWWLLLYIVFVPILKIMILFIDE
jgi:hypothetical protein